jgi:hypothetical protein
MLVTVDEMSVGKMNLDRMSVDKLHAACVQLLPENDIVKLFNAFCTSV